MNIDKIKKRIEFAGLKSETPAEGNNDFVKLLVEGGPILHAYGNGRIVLLGQNLELLKGVFPRNSDANRAISAYVREQEMAGVLKIYQVMWTTTDPLTCRILAKAIRQLTGEFIIKCETI